MLRTTTAFFITASVLLISGCAATAADYMRVSEQKLCFGYLTLPSYNIHQSARKEAIRLRGIDCSKHHEVSSLLNSYGVSGSVVPFKGVTPSAPLEQALAICKGEGEIASNEARYVEEMNATIRNKGEMSGGFVGGAAEAMNLNIVRDKASTSAVKTCLARYGYKME